MLQVFYGDDRGRAQRDIRSILGADYEVFDGTSLQLADMDSIFRGTTLFAENRKILIRDLGENKDGCFESLVEYKDTPHEVIIWEGKLDGRSSFAKDLKKSVRCVEYKAPPLRDRNFAFNIFDQAWQGRGKQAVEMCEQIRYEEAPYQVMGALIWKGTDKLEKDGGEKARKTIKLLAKADMDMKSSKVEPWLIVESCLLEIAAL